jgi:hypothetical protein
MVWCGGDNSVTTLKDGVSAYAAMAKHRHNRTATKSLITTQLQADASLSRQDFVYPSLIIKSFPDNKIAFEGGVLLL